MTALTPAEFEAKSAASPLGPGLHHVTDGVTATSCDCGIGARHDVSGRLVSLVWPDRVDYCEAWRWAPVLGPLSGGAR